MITKAPTMDEFYGTADLTLGNYDLVRARAAINVPMGDSFATRLSLQTNEHEGFTDNIVNGQAQKGLLDPTPNSRKLAQGLHIQLRPGIPTL